MEFVLASGQTKALVTVGPTFASQRAMFLPFEQRKGA